MAHHYTSSKKTMVFKVGAVVDPTKRQNKLASYVHSLVMRTNKLEAVTVQRSLACLAPPPRQYFMHILYKMGSVNRLNIGTAIS